MPTIFDAASGEAVKFLDRNFLPAGEFPSVDAELYPHFMVPHAQPKWAQHDLAVKIKNYFMRHRAKLDNNLEITIFSETGGNVYRRNKCIPRRYETEVFRDIVILTFETLGFDNKANSICKGSEPWAAPPLDPYFCVECQQRRVYTYAIYSECAVPAPRCFMGPINIPYFYCAGDSLPLTKNNVPQLFCRLTNYIKNRIECVGAPCIRLQYVVTEKDDIPDCEQTTLNQIAGFRRLWCGNAQKHTDAFKKYIDMIEELYREKKREQRELTQTLYYLHA